MININRLALFFSTFHVVKAKPYWLRAKRVLLIFGITLINLSSVVSHSRVSQNVSYEAVFNTPGFTGKSTTTIEDKLIELIGMSAVNSDIFVSLYTVSRAPIIDALVSASRRGVNVKVVLDGKNSKFLKNEDSVVNLLRRTLICKDQVAGCVQICKGIFGIGYGCRGIAINHNKFMLFSKLSDGSENVIASTSSNMNPGQLKMYNDLLIIKNDKPFFDQFKLYWNDLQQDSTTFLTAAPTALGSGNVKAYFSPRGFSGDPVLSVLDKVSCHLPQSSVRVATSIFTRQDIAKKMKELASRGCKVEVITRSDSKSTSPSSSVKDILGENITVLPFRGPPPEPQAENSIHSKVILIHASFDGSDQKIPIVLSGSHNLNTSSLYFNDETLVELHDQNIFERYSAYLDQIVRDSAFLLKE